MTSRLEHTSLLGQLGRLPSIDLYYKNREMPTGAELREAQERHHREATDLLAERPDEGQTE
ncbi:hypothetical protein KKF55_01395 [Patescibacteria group bacterium]|nr:hypothetical protein [Patescibacteria group bacterium]